MTGGGRKCETETRFCPIPIRLPQDPGLVRCPMARHRLGAHYRGHGTCHWRTATLRHWRGTRNRAGSGGTGRYSKGRGLPGRRGQHHNVNLLVPSTYGYPIRAAPWVLRLNQRVKRSGKHYLARRRVGLKASTNVDSITQRSEVQYAPRSHIADESGTSVSSDTEGQLGDLRGQFESGNRCLASIVEASDTLDEETHHLVANQLVHNAFVANQYLRRGAIELGQTLGERSDIQVLTQSCRGAHVGENNSDVDLDLSIGGQMIEAGLTEIRLLREGLRPRRPTILPPTPPKGLWQSLQRGSWGR